jgi:hypothetical protein
MINEHLLRTNAKQNSNLPVEIKSAVSHQYAESGRYLSLASENRHNSPHEGMNHAVPSIFLKPTTPSESKILSIFIHEEREFSTAHV